MPTNLLIGYPDIPLRAASLASDLGSNIITGSRSQLGVRSSAGTVSVEDYDLVTTAQPEYFAVMRADFLRRGDTAATLLELLGDSTAAFSSPETQSTTFELADLVGPGGEDFIYSTTFASAHRYWRFRITTTASFKHAISKLYFGQWFDFGRDPIYDPQLDILDQRSGERRSRRRFRLTWRGITYQKQRDFFDLIGRYALVNPVLIYDSNDYWLENRAMHCAITDQKFSIREANDWTIEIELTELV